MKRVSVAFFYFFYILNIFDDYYCPKVVSKTVTVYLNMIAFIINCNKKVLTITFTFIKNAFDMGGIVILNMKQLFGLAVIE